MKNRTPHDIVKYDIEALEKLIKNLLINNINFTTGYYFRTLPGTIQYVNGPLKEHTNHILTRLSSTKELILSYLKEEPPA